MPLAKTQPQFGSGLAADKKLLILEPSSRISASHLLSASPSTPKCSGQVGERPSCPLRVNYVEKVRVSTQSNFFSAVGAVFRRDVGDLIVRF